MQEFEYAEAFSRNIGWVTPEEQDRLRNARVAIAGLGGVGGGHLLALSRLGIGAFNLAELDTFEVANFNRQACATMSSVGHKKLDTAVAMARDINPELQLRVFPSGISNDNIDEFLDGVDVFIDGLDFFVFELRAAVFKACREKGIPAVTVAPLGMSAALLVFRPDTMPFEDYFRLEDATDATDLALRFLLGLAPRMAHRDYLVWPEAVDLEGRRGPSSIVACQLCAGLAAGAALKLILKRGKVPAAPHGLQFDAYKGRAYRTWCPGGNRNPIMRLKRHIARKIVTPKGK